MTVRLYHTTNRAAARAILRSGFRDAVGRFMTEVEHRGVWLSDRPLDCNEGAKGDVVLAVEIDGRRITQFEWKEFASLRSRAPIDKGYREWCAPAAVINRHGNVLLIDAGRPQTPKERLVRATKLLRAMLARGDGRRGRDRRDRVRQSVSPVG